MKILQSINKNTSLELHFGSSITEHQYVNLENILTNQSTLTYNIKRIFFDDENSGIIQEVITNANTGDVLFDKYKQVEVLNKEEIAKNKILYLINETPLTSDIIEYYEAEIFDISKQQSAKSYNIILEPGIQAYLSKIEIIDLTHSSSTTSSKSNETIKTKYTFIIEFNTHIIQYYKLERLIEKYVKKINFYMNLPVIMRSKLQSLFKTKYIPEQNRILNKPATLERKDIPKIALNYTITDKADGIRHLFIIDKYSTGYLIGNKFDIKHIFEKPISGLSDCIIDGEYVEMPGDEPDKYLIFDLLQYKGKSMLKKPFIERMKYMNMMVDLRCGCGKSHPILFNSGKRVEVKVKQFYMLKDFLDTVSGDIDIPQKIMSYPFLSVLPRNNYIEVMTELWNNRTTKFPYLLDGLILTPLNGLYIPENRSFLIYKWKDIHTIDVRVMANKDDDLLWNFDVNRKSGANADIISGYTYDERKDLSNEITTGITDGLIVEFMWSSKQKQFIPIRVREDKIVPNSRLTVESVIQAINDDIKVNELFDLDKASLQFGDAFYQEKNVNKREREQSLDITFKKFHNYIKNELIKYPGDDYNRGTTLLDLSAGKGGDIHKWIHAGYKEILAVDITSTALDEFNKRVKKIQKTKIGKDVNFTLINTDSTKRLITGQAGLTPEEQHRLRNYFTIEHPAMRFSKVVCNFSISYMFNEEDPTATGFFTNITDTLATIDEGGNDGYFVGTIIDGNLLDKVFITDGKKEIIAKINGEIFYTIKPVGEYSKKSLNNKILVSRPAQGGWANPIPEPVIYPEFITETANSMGLKYVEFTGFEEYYSKFVKKEKLKMSDGEKLISFLHKTFVISW
jgi:hypothetical protein